MPFVNIDILNVQPPKLPPVGQPVKLRIESVDVKPSKSNPNRQVVNLRMSCVDYPDTAPLWESLCTVVEDDSDNTRYMIARRMKQFAECFGLEANQNGVSIEPGPVGNAILKIEKDRNDEDRAVVAHYITADTMAINSALQQENAVQPKATTATDASGLFKL